MLPLQSLHMEGLRNKSGNQKSVGWIFVKDNILYAYDHLIMHNFSCQTLEIRAEETCHCTK